jgi:hypothetical protein
VKRLNGVGEIKLFIGRVSRPVIKRSAKFGDPKDPEYNGNKTPAKVYETAMKAEVKCHSTK